MLQSVYTELFICIIFSYESCFAKEMLLWSSFLQQQIYYFKFYKGIWT